MDRGFGGIASWSRSQSVAGFGLRARLVAFIALALLPAFALVVYTGHQKRADIVSDTEAHALELAQQGAALQTRTMDGVRALLAVLSESPWVRRSPEECSTGLRRLLQQQPHLANLGVIELNGRINCSALPISSAVDVSDRRYYQKALQNRAFSIGEYQIGRITGVASINAAMPIFTGEEITAVVFASIKLDWINDVAARAELVNGATFTLLDEEHRVLVRQPGPAELGAYAPERQILSRLAQERGSYIGEQIIDGRPVLLAYTRPSGTGAIGAGDLRALVTIPSAVAFAEADRITRRHLVLLASAGLAALMFAWFGSNLVVLRPVRRLAGAAQRLANGDLTARTGLPHGRGELDQLATAFDTMAETLELRDLENREQALRIARLNRVYHTLTGINGAIVRIHDREQLLEEACRIAVEFGGLRLAWVGLIDPDKDELQIAAHAGIGLELVQSLRILYRDDSGDGCEFIRTALMMGTAAVKNDVFADPGLSVLHDDCRELGVNAVAVFPLSVHGQATGVLALYSDEKGFFDTDEVRLLEEVAADISLGLTHIERERQLNYLAYWDPLTSLPNRSLFTDRLDQAVSRAERDDHQLVVMIIDVLQFAHINDTLGRHVGDHILQTLAGRLSRVCRESDSLASFGTHAGRVASHEFALLIESVTDVDVACKVADRIRSAVEMPVEFGNQSVNFRVRMGAANYPAHGINGHRLLHSAELAAHSIDNDEADQLRFYSDDLDHQVRERGELEAALLSALAKNQFSLHYQPLVETRTGRVLGAEALLRWSHPELGPIGPDRFIPILEELGLMTRVGEWVLETACRQLVEWSPMLDPAFVMSVNVCSLQLRAGDFLSRASQIVAAAGLRPDRIELEITETGLMDTASATLDRLTDLKEAGFHLAIDDFGTGYSSLSYLREFPVDTLKIDRSFIRDIPHDSESLSIVRTVVALARTLNLDIVAEGVETETQLRLLGAENCDRIQGYYFSRPVPADQFLALVRQPFEVPADYGSGKPELVPGDRRSASSPVTGRLRRKSAR